MNTSTISGNLAKDPELRQTTSGTKVATYTIGVFRPNPKDKNNPLTDWFNVVAWGDQADVVMSNLKKGSRVLVNGRFQTRHYEDKDGKTVYVTELFQSDFWLAPHKEKASTQDDNGSIYNDNQLPF